MNVFVLMADGGYDGDALLGVYATEERARHAGAAWSRERYNGIGTAQEETYVEAVEVDAAAKERQTAIARSHEEERRSRRL
jgi:hypothetical protein